MPWDCGTMGPWDRGDLGTGGQVNRRQGVKHAAYLDSAKPRWGQT